MKIISKLSHKRKRQALGMIMMAMFIAEGQTIYFLAKASSSFGSQAWLAFLIMLGVFWYLWLPPIICIVLIYLILMRVLKYQEVDK